ncbi:hypothetical protein CHELA1G2_10607 [Hyphomicrobiales bacterium]|nr:hypothetical protein CHELA1G2_10607 [Hyphomicrobiales bacterium]
MSLETHQARIGQSLLFPMFPTMQRLGGTDAERL